MKLKALLVGVLLAAIAGCAGKKSGKGFTLPDGNAKQGKAVFVNLKCHSCHTVVGADLPELVSQVEKRVTLGGEVARVKTYGQLVTSIINPSHRIAKGYAKGSVDKDGVSKMKNYNDVLTVQELIDLVAFLEDHYKLREYDSTDYPIFP